MGILGSIACSVYIIIELSSWHHPRKNTYCTHVFYSACHCSHIVLHRAEVVNQTLMNHRHPLVNIRFTGVPSVPPSKMVTPKFVRRFVYKQGTTMWYLPIYSTAVIITYVQVQNCITDHVRQVHYLIINNITVYYLPGHSV